jgi:glycine/D-amino acid oxidase-like deaminating enzyme/nitrite reductase/ring-hydroxylating ferredoxin subunit
VRPVAGYPQAIMSTLTSYWLESTPWQAYPALEEDLETDVAVIGAGIAGLSTAWELVNRGRSVTVLEANRIAAGVTGHTTAKLSALHGDLYGHLTRRLGAGTASAYAAAQLRAMDRVREVVAELGIDCDLETRPAYVYTLRADRADGLRAEAETVSAAGLPATFGTDIGLPFEVAGAVKVDDQLMFHPRKYLLGLAADLVARGGRIAELTRVTDLHEGSPCSLSTATGHRVTAAEVVVATHYPVFDRSLLFARLVPRREFAVAGLVDEPDDPPGMYLSRDDGIRSIRSTPYQGRRLLIATGEEFAPGAQDTAEHVRRLTGWLRERFAVAEVGFTWAAQDNHSSDRLPFIGPLHPLARHSWVATGFGGWGMTNGVLAGMLLADLIDDEKPDWAWCFDPRRIHPATEAGPVTRAAARTISSWAESRLRARLPSADAVTEIGPGQAAVIESDGNTWAVHRDDDGTLHGVSAICTHMGCQVAFNAVEREWECPCHGSRFGLDGDVIQGPATTPLRRWRGGTAQGSR